MDSKRHQFTRHPMYLSFPARKGGVGKTMLAANTAAFLANDGYKVLLVGADTQEDATVTYLSRLDDFDLYDHPSLSNVLFDGMDVREAVITSPSYPGYRYDLKSHKRTKDGEYTIDMICAGSRISELNGEDEWAVKDAIAPIEEEYDFIIFDTPPSENNGVLHALTASDYAVIPVNMDDAAATYGSIEMVVGNIRTATESGSGIRNIGIVANMLDNSSRLHESTLQELKENIPGLLFQTCVHRTIVIPNAAALAIPVCSYPNSSNAQYDLAQYCMELLERLRTYEEEN